MIPCDKTSEVCGIITAGHKVFIAGGIGNITLDDIHACGKVGGNESQVLFHVFKLNDGINDFLPVALNRGIYDGSVDLAYAVKDGVDMQCVGGIEFKNEPSAESSQSEREPVCKTIAVVSAENGKQIKEEHMPYPYFSGFTRGLSAFVLLVLLVVFIQRLVRRLLFKNTTK